MSLKKIIASYWKSIIIIVVIIYLSFAPPSTFKEVPTFEIPNLDKIIHFCVYSVLSFFLNFDFSKSTSSKKQLFIWICFVFPIILGGLIEIAQQQFFAPRTAEWIDFISNSVGVFTGWRISKFLKISN